MMNKITVMNTPVTGETADVVKILDIGCGRRKTPGATGIDILKVPGVDICWDLNTFPWPLPADSCDRIVCNHILEHLENVVQVMDEIHRVGKRDALVHIEGPHFSHPDAYSDPTHRRYFSYFTFDYFTGNPMYPSYSDSRFRLVSRSFKAVSGINRFLSSRRSPRFYEERLSRIFPAYGVVFDLQVLK